MCQINQLTNSLRQGAYKCYVNAANTLKMNKQSYYESVVIVLMIVRKSMRREEKRDGKSETKKKEKDRIVLGIKSIKVPVIRSR